MQERRCPLHSIQTFKAYSPRYHNITLPLILWLLPKAGEFQGYVVSFFFFFCFSLFWKLLYQYKNEPSVDLIGYSWHEEDKTAPQALCTLPRFHPVIFPAGMYKFKQTHRVYILLLAYSLNVKCNEQRSRKLTEVITERL